MWAADSRQVVRIGPDGRPDVVWQAPRFSEIVRFEAADLEGDGVSEWLVLLRFGTLRSQVVALQDELVALREAAALALTLPVAGVLLLWRAVTFVARGFAVVSVDVGSQWVVAEPLVLAAIALQAARRRRRG